FFLVALAATVRPTAAASATRKNQIFDRNTAPSLLRRRERARRNLGVVVGGALRLDRDVVLRAGQPAVPVPDLQLVAARRHVRDLELAVVVGVRDVLRADDDQRAFEVRRVGVAEVKDLARFGHAKRLGAGGIDRTLDELGIFLRD